MDYHPSHLIRLISCFLQLSQGQGRQARRREAQQRLAYQPPPQEADHDPATRVVRPPEGHGVFQDSAIVAAGNTRLTEIYDTMVEIFEFIRGVVSKRKELKESADASMEWAPVAPKIRQLNMLIEERLSDYDRLAEGAVSKRTRIRLDGGHPVEPPALLSVHPRSMLGKKV